MVKLKKMRLQTATSSNTSPVVHEVHQTAFDTHPIQPAPAGTETVELSDEEGNDMLQEWEDEIHAINAHEDDVSFAMNKKMEKISNMLSYTENAEQRVEASQTQEAHIPDNENRGFRADWKIGRSWLVLRGNKMYCTACEAAGKKNIFTSGCPRMKKDYIMNHQKLAEHLLACDAPKLADEFEVAKMNAIKLEVRDDTFALLPVFFSAHLHFCLFFFTMRTQNCVCLLQQLTFSVCSSLQDDRLFNLFSIVYEIAYNKDSLASFPNRCLGAEIRPWTVAFSL